MGKRVLVIDDEETVLDALKIILEEMGHQVDTTSDPLEGERQAIEGEYDLIITDLRMPGRSGDHIVQSIKAARQKARVLVITAYSTDVMAQNALQAGALALVRKPFEISKILSYLEQD